MNPVIGILILVLVGGFAILLAVAARDPRDYDERQRIVHGRAYMAAFWVFALVTLGLAMLQLLLGRAWFDTLSVVLLGFVPALTVFSVICVCGDAYEKRGVKQRRAALGIAALVVVYAINVLVRGGPLYRAGSITGAGLYLMIAGCYLVTLIAYCIKWLRNRRGEDSE